MIPFFEYAALASYVYSDTNTEVGIISISKLNTKGLLEKQYLNASSYWYCLVDVDPYAHPSKHFFAQLYVKIVNGVAIDAVMAIRGTLTSDSDNIEQDVRSFSSDVMGDGSHDVLPELYLIQAMTFYVSCESYLQQYFPHLTYKVKVTGHSLGGAIAQLLPLKAGYPTPVIAFNSPGCGHIPGVKKELAGWVHNINSRYGFINKIGLTLGKLYVIDVPYMREQAQDFFDHFDKKDYQASLEDDYKAEHATNFLSFLYYDIAGDISRFLAYLVTLDRVHNTPAMQKEYFQGVSEADANFWVRAQAILLGRSIDIQTFKAALIAQHAMNNMINALAMPQNLKVAYTRI